METLLEKLVEEIKKQVESGAPDHEKLRVLNETFSNVSHHLRMIADTSRQQNNYPPIEGYARRAE